LQQNFGGMILGWPPSKIVSDDAMHQPTWPLLLKIEHMVKLHVLGNNPKTINNIKNLTCGKNYENLMKKREVTPKWVMGFPSTLQGG
jgi:hypothetical protein